MNLRKHFKKNFITMLLMSLLICIFPMVGNSTYLMDGEQSTTALSASTEAATPVCCLSSDNAAADDNGGITADKYYTTIEAGLAKATSTDTLYVLPGVTTTINSDITIPSGVSMILPYSGITYTNGDDEEGTTSEDWSSVSSSGFADSTASNVINTNRKTLVTLAASKTITVNGNLYVGGMTGTTATKIINQTSSKYCEILMLADSKITVAGKLVSYGYIKKCTYVTTTTKSGSNSNTATVEITESGSVKVPLVIYDYKGGNVTLSLIDEEVCPFEIFDFPNIQATMKFVSGAKLYGNIRINASVSSYSVNYETDILIIGDSADDPVIEVDDGFAEVAYSAASDGITTYTAASPSSNSTTMITASGTISQNYLYISLSDDFGTIVRALLSAMGFGTTVDTREMALPISYKLNFKIGSGSTLNILYPVKFMPGSTARIETGAILNVSDDGSLLLYSNSYTDPVSSSLGSDYAYPTSSLNDAKLVCNGTFNLTGSFGGTLTTEVTDAVFDATSGTLSASSVDGYAHNSNTNVIETVSADAQGYIDGTSSISTFSNYKYASTTDDSTNYYWERDISSYTMSIVVNSISTGSHTFTMTYTSGGVENSISYTSKTTTGISVDAGTTVTVTYYKSGLYKGTITVTDSDGNQIAYNKASSTGGTATVTFTAEGDYTITTST